MFIRAWFYWGVFYLPVHPSTSLSVYVNLTMSAVHLCWIWTASAECFLFVFLSSGLELIPLSLPALWSHIIPNTVKSAKCAPRVNANQIHGPVYCTHHFTVSLNPIIALGLSFSLTHSFIYSFIHSSDRAINRSKDRPCFTVYCCSTRFCWIFSKGPVLYSFFLKA